MPPKTKVYEHRYDFRGGRVSSISPDLLNINELVDTTNARISHQYGGFEKRSGCQRLHSSAFITPIMGCVQWDGPNGKQIVVIAGDGKLYWRDGFTYTGSFTQVTPGTLFSTTQPASFEAFRATTASAPLVLYIASGGHYYSWDGTATLTKLDGTNNAPTADFIRVYHTRMFAHQPTLLKHLFWSRVGDATFFTTGTGTDGGSAITEVLNGEKLVALEVIGSSLLLVSTDSVMRFSGQDNNNIQISQDSEGVTAEVGSVGQLALKRFENAAAMLSIYGPYVLTELYAQTIGEKVKPDFELNTNLDGTNVSKSQLAWNRQRREMCFIVPRTVDSGVPKTIYPYSVRLQTWQGPWTYSFGMVYANRFQRSDNTESFMSAGSDGFVRDMDTGIKDDVLADGTGGTNISLSVTLPVLHFGDPGIVKALRWMKLQANLPIGSNLAVGVVVDGVSTGTFTPVPSDSGEEDYRVDLVGVGRRPVLTFTESSAQAPVVYGVSLMAHDMVRTL